MVAFIQKAHGCIFFCYVIEAQAAQLAISDRLIMSAGARCPVWVDREVQFVADAEEESKRGETIFDAAARHCNERL
jgi:hypothetical protein